MNEKLNLKDRVLLMRDEGEGNKLKAVKGIDKKGKIEAVDPMKAKPTDFLTIDKHADPLENFFKNFINQTKNPSHTGFYAVTVDMLDKILRMGEKELEKFRVNPQDFLNQQKEQSTNKTEKEVVNEKNVDVKPITEEKPAEQQTEFKQFDTNRIPESEYQNTVSNPKTLKENSKL